MCMKYEDKYSQCSDHLTLGSEMLDNNTELDIIKIIENWLGAEIDRDKADRDIRDLLDTWHENKIMKPL